MKAIIPEVFGDWIERFTPFHVHASLFNRLAGLPHAHLFAQNGIAESEV